MMRVTDIGPVSTQLARSNSVSAITPSKTLQQVYWVLTRRLVAMRDLYMKSGQGFLLVFSIASRTTFEELETLRDDIIRIKDDEDIPIVIVGNKADLEDQRSVDRARAFALSQRWNAPYYEASARTRSKCQSSKQPGYGWSPLLTNAKPTSTSPLSTSAGKCYGARTSTRTRATTRIPYEQTTRAPNGGAERKGRKSAPFYEPAFFLVVEVPLVRRRAGPDTQELL
jgi:hypothetical protein